MSNMIAFLSATFASYGLHCRRSGKIPSICFYFFLLLSSCRSVVWKTNNNSNIGMLNEPPVDLAGFASKVSDLWPSISPQSFLVSAQSTGFDDPPVEKLCTKTHRRAKHSKSKILMMVATLDGRLTVFQVDARRNDIPTAWRCSLVKFNISMTKLWESQVSESWCVKASGNCLSTDGDDTIIVVPSLQGGLFIIRGDHIESLPFTIDTLLGTDTRVPDNFSIVGSKRVEFLKLDANTGETIFKKNKSKKWSNQFSQRLPEDGENITIEDSHLNTSPAIFKLITRQIEAVNLRNGDSNWKFEVLELKLLDNHQTVLPQEEEEKEECEQSGSEEANGDPAILKEDLAEISKLFRFSLSDGSVCFFNSESDSGSDCCNLGSSIVRAWVTLAVPGQPLSAVHEVDLMMQCEPFVSSSWPSLGVSHKLTVESQSSDPPLGKASRMSDKYEKLMLEREELEPIMYVGRIQDHLYIQITDKYLSKMMDVARHVAKTKTAFRGFPLSWIKSLLSDVGNDQTGPAFNEVQDDAGSGRYDQGLMRPKSLSTFLPTPSSRAVGFVIVVTNNATFECLNKPALPVESIALLVINVVSMLTVIACMTSKSICDGILQLKLVSRLSRLGDWTLETCLYAYFKLTRFDDNLTDTSPNQFKEWWSLKMALKLLRSHVSRYESEYQHIGVLGKGGFGIVLEAKNRLDYRRVAVKRIRQNNLCDNEIMKEIRYLAQLFHPNVVYYNTAWIEVPPADWQAARDKILLKRWRCEFDAIEVGEGLSSAGYDDTVGDSLSDEVSIPTSNNKVHDDESSTFDWGRCRPDLGDDPVPATVKQSKGVTENANPLSDSKSFEGLTAVNATTSMNHVDFDVVFDRSGDSGDDEDEEEEEYEEEANVEDDEDRGNSWDAEESGDIDFDEDFDDGIEEVGTSCENQEDDELFDSEDDGSASAVSNDVVARSSISRTSSGIGSFDFKQPVHASISNPGVLAPSDTSADALHESAQSSTGSNRKLASSFEFTCEKPSHNVSVVRRIPSFVPVKVEVSQMSFSERGRSSKVKKAQATKKDEKEQTGSVSSYLYICMELCRRDTLREWLLHHVDSRPMDQALWYFIQIVRGVEYIHSGGLIHRDLKPSNIFFSLNNSSVVKIGDFGLMTKYSPEDESTSDELVAVARVEEVEEERKNDKNAVGTELYMSPEQFKKPLRISYKVDMYALGIILFEILYPFGSKMERVMTLKCLRALMCTVSANNNINKLATASAPLPLADESAMLAEFQREYNLIQKFMHSKSQEWALVRWLLALNPNDRPSSCELMKNPMFIELAYEYMEPATFRMTGWRRARYNSSSQTCM